MVWKSSTQRGGRVRERATRWRLAWVRIMLGGALLLIAFVIVACNRGDDKAEQAAAAIEAAQMTGTSLTRVEAEGKRLYNYYCALCHGESGQGDGFNAYNLDPRPQPFQDNRFLTKAQDEDIATVIREGGRRVGKSVLMPPYGNTLSEEEIRALVAYMRILSEKPTATDVNAASD